MFARQMVKFLPSSSKGVGGEEFVLIAYHLSWDTAQQRRFMAKVFHFLIASATRQLLKT
jgi:hypothetical protein